LVADKHTSIPVAEFKAQLSDTSDIMGRMDLAPCTKKMMNYLSTKGFGKLFSSPGNPLLDLGKFFRVVSVFMSLHYFEISKILMQLTVMIIEDNKNGG
jgi:hypothetical protein